MKIKKTHTDLNIFFYEHFRTPSNHESDPDIDLLIGLISIIRPKNRVLERGFSIFGLLDILRSNEDYRKYFSAYIKAVIGGRRFSHMLSDLGIINDSSFSYEVKKRLVAKLIPRQPHKGELEYVLNQVFYKSTDPVWITKIPFSELSELHRLLDASTFSFHSEVLFALELLSHRIAGRAMEYEVIKMVPEYQNFDSPFLAFDRELSSLTSKLGNSWIKEDDQDYRQIILLHKQCLNYVSKAFENSSKYGISLKVNLALIRMRQQLIRLRTLLDLLVAGDREQRNRNSLNLGLLLIKYNCGKNNIRTLLNESTQLLAYEITKHTARTGETYITSSWREYIRMFWASCGAGVIVAFACIIKVLLSKIHTSPFGYAALYSVNYAVAFITIYLSGAILATKQPAMTASALVKVLESGYQNKTSPSGEKHQAFAEFFARLFRSQFVAFLGNVIVAFPVALLGIWLIDLISGHNIALTKWYKLINDNSPITSPAIFHASIAGFFLFLSGLIAGNIANRDKHENMHYRIQEHPLLKMSIGKTKAVRFAEFYRRKWAGIISNFWFGIFMGSTFSIGVFLGLDLDIRHITFVSSNLALGLYGANFNVSTLMLIWGIVGIGVIGFVNFTVSFGLSLALAFRSRDLPISELKLVAAATLKHFKRRPASFFLPPSGRWLSQKHQQPPSYQ